MNFINVLKASVQSKTLPILMMSLRKRHLHFLMIMIPVASMKHEKYHWLKESSIVILHNRKLFWLSALNRSPGIDGVPAEFVKACKQSLAEPVAMVLNYIIENRDFPELWAGGIRSAVFKSSKHNIVDNFRGITILPIMEKIFEAIVYKRLTFVNETFDEID